MKSKVLTVAFVIAALLVGWFAKPSPNCKCDPCTCENCDCKALVPMVDDSAKGYVTVIVPPGYAGWATAWADSKIKSENHYTVLLTSSPLYKERFAKAVPHTPCILLQNSHGKVIDKLYDTKAAECCPWKRKKKEEPEQEAAPVPEDVKQEIAEEKEHSGAYILIALAGAAAGLAAVWHERKTTPTKKS